MAKVRIKASAESISKGGQDRGDFVVPKPGFYILTMTECNPGFSKDAEGNEDKKKPRLECIYKITGVGREEAETKENYGNLWDYVSFSESSDWKRGEFLKAFGYVEDGSSDFDDDIDTDDVINRKVLARVKHEKARTKGDPARAKIASLFESGGDVSYGDEEPAFGSSDEEAETVHTEDDLNEMDLKGVGAVLEELGGNPRDHIVKDAKGKVDSTKTKAAVIEAILKAQGGDEADDDPFGEQSDEEPF